MLAKTYAKKIKGGNGYRRILVLFHFVLWLAVTAVCALYALRLVNAFGIEIVDKLMDAYVKEAGSPFASTVRRVGLRATVPAVKTSSCLACGEHLLSTARTRDTISIIPNGFTR